MHQIIYDVVADICVSHEAVHCKWTCDKACTASRVWCFCKTKVPRLFSFSPEGARKWEVQVGDSYFLLVKCWCLRTSALWLLSWKGVPLAQALSRLFS